jgi:septum formation protein
MVPTLLLASTSRYRAELLSRLGLAFDTVAPGVDEASRGGESPRAQALRLAKAKADAVARSHPGSWVIGSDQVAELDGHRLDKPGTHERAAEQLGLLSGRFADFHTAVAVVNSATGRLQSRIVPTRVHFRALTRRQIDAYLQREQPFDCAGSAKSEGLGIALIQRIEGTDPTALIGLPLIALTEMLGAEGLEVL